MTQIAVGNVAASQNASADRRNRALYFPSKNKQGRLIPDPVEFLTVLGLIAMKHRRQCRAANTSNAQQVRQTGSEQPNPHS